MGEPVVPLWLSAWVLALAAPLAILLPMLSALLERSGPIRLRHWAEEAGGGLRVLYESPARFEAFRVLVSLAAKLTPLVLLGALWAALEGLGIAGAWWIALLAVALILFVTEWIDHALVELHAEDSLSRLTGPLRVVHTLLRPGVWLLSHWVAVAEEPVEEEEDEASEGEIDAFIDVGRREGILEPEEEELVRSIVDFGDTQVRSVMTPRVEIQSVPVSASPEELAAKFFESKHSRLPVHGESIDQIVGILHIRDLFEVVQNGRETDVAELVKPPHYVPEYKASRELLEELQKRHQQMAIVVDEYGGVAGLVTVEDLVEEIVGEIADEHERPHRQRMQLDDHRWRLRGRMALEDLDEIFELDVDVDELPYETVSGLICGELGYVPAAGELVEAHGLSFDVEEADERRVTTVVVSPAARVEADKGAALPSESK